MTLLSLLVRIVRGLLTIAEIGILALARATRALADVNAYRKTARMQLRHHEPTLP